MTGRLKAQNAKEQQKADQENADEARRQSVETAHDDLVGVYDPKTGDRIDDDGVDVIDVDDDGEGESEFEEAAEFPQFPRLRTDQEPVFTGQEDPDTVAPIIAARRSFSQPDVEITRATTVKIRVDQDIEKMTYGMRNGEPNNYDFREGAVYRVEWGLYEHLNERGLVRQMIG